MINYRIMSYSDTEVRLYCPDTDQEEVIHCGIREFFKGLKIYRDDRSGVQDAFSFLDDGEREFLISGINKEEWAALEKAMFIEEEKAYNAFLEEKANTVELLFKEYIGFNEQYGIGLSKVEYIQREAKKLPL